MLLADSVVRVDGVHGTQECRTVVVTADDGSGQLTLGQVGPMHDDVIYERGRWYFARRRVGTPVR